MQNAYASYAENEILTAEPEKLVLLMYQGAIKFIRQARIAIAEKRVEDAHNAILRAYAIVAELMATLDRERGGEIAANLERSYEFILSHLRSADATKDDKPLKEVEDLLVPLAETWESAFFRNETRIARKQSGPDTYKPLSMGSTDKDNGRKPVEETKSVPAVGYGRLVAYEKSQSDAVPKEEDNGGKPEANSGPKPNAVPAGVRKPGKLDLHG